MMNYKLSPYKHQLSGIHDFISNTVMANHDEMGTGKSKILVDATCALATMGKVNACVIVCPNTVKSNWTDAEKGEIIINGWDNLDQGVYQIDAGKKLWPLERLGNHELQWVVVNYDVIWRDRVKEWLQQFMTAHKSIMALDESHFIKTPSKKRSRGCIALGKYAVRRYLLSGTPITKNILDAYSQFRFLDWSILGYANFSMFKNDVIVYEPDSYIRDKKGNPVVIKEFKNVDKITAAIAPYYRRVLKKDCLDLPDKIFTTVEVPMGTELEKLYTQMKEKMVAEFPEGKVKAPIVLTKLLKLAQICSGFINYIDENGEKATQKFVCPKLVEVIERIKNHDGSTVVFYQMTPEREMLEEALKKEGIDYYTLYGSIKQSDRKAIIDGFQSYEKPVILCQQRTGGIGIPLFAADLVLFYSNDPGWDKRVQAEDRAHRNGQKKSVLYVDFFSTYKGHRTVEHWVRDLNKQKEAVAESIIMTREELIKFLDTM